MKTRYTILPILFLLGLISCNFVASNKSEGNGARVLALNYDPSTVNSGDAYKQTKLSVQGKLSYPDGTPIEYANLNIKSAGLTTSLSVRSTSGYLSFGDVDVDRGEIEGVLFLKKVSDETDIKSYTLYWANADNISLSKIATFYKTGTDPSYVFKENTPIYTGAKKFTFFSVDKSGNETLLEALEFKDSGPSFSTDENGNYTIILGLGKSKIGVSKDGKDLGDISISIESVDAKPIPEVTSSEFSAVVTGVTQLSPEDVKALESVTKPTVPPSTISFTDTDPDALQLGGEILIGKASAESNITHYGLYFAQSATVKARLLAFIAKTGSDIKVTISGNLPIPEGSQYLMVVSKNTAGEMSTGPSVLINDYVKPPTAPSLTAASISFTDTDNTQNAIAGQVSITKASDESNIDSYVLYWGNSATTRLSTTPIAELNKTGANLVYNVATNTAIPAGATHFLVFTKNAVGEMVTGISVAIVDTLPNAKEITSFSIPSIPQATAIITGTNIALNIPFGNAITNLVAGFTTTGASVKIGTTVQVSGTTANDFTNPLTYTVTAVDGSTQNYTVTTTVAANQAPVASSVTFSGSITLASSLTGTFSYSDPDGHTAGTHTYQWYRCTDNTSAPPTNCSAISGATGITYTLTIADDLKYIRFAVTPVDQYALAGTMVYSSPSVLLNFAPVAGNSGNLSISSLADTSLTVNWTAATDGTPQSSMQYLLYQSSSNNIATIANMEANGTAIGTYTSNIISKAVTGLTINNTYYFNVIALDANGNKTAYTMISATTVRYTFADSQIPPGWSFAGNASWFITSTDCSSNGVEAPCLRSGVITDSQTTSITATITVTNSAISFHRKVAGEDCCDKCEFKIDGVVQSGEPVAAVDQMYNFPISNGSHTVEWRYYKDGSVTTPPDACFIDNISY
ncbi:MAG: hypothetical protein H7A25_20505 [Leptospiraceae bacterium]|nr:hypothetical protein [Leptospiraceae bacterium]